MAPTEDCVCSLNPLEKNGKLDCVYPNSVSLSIMALLLSFTERFKNVINVPAEYHKSILA